MPRSVLTRILCATLSLWVAVVIATTAQAQIIPGFGVGTSNSAEKSAQSQLAQAIRDAADGGVNVIVIGENGQIITASSSRPDSAPKASGQDAMGGASILMRVQSRVSKFRESLRGRLNTLPSSFTEVAYILRATSPDGRIMRYVEILGWSLLLFLGAMIVTRELYGKRFARRFVESKIKDAPQGYRQKMPFLVFRFLIGIGSTLITMLLAYIAGALIFGPADDLSVQITITAIYVAFFAARTVSDIWRMILSPYLSQYRIPRFSDRDARRLYFWARILATYDITAIMFSTWIADFGLNYDVYAFIYGVLALVGAVGNSAMVLFNARPISRAIRGGKPASETTYLAKILSITWAPALIVYIAFTWLKLAFDLVLEQAVSIPLVAGTYGVFISVIVVYGVINYIIERFFARLRKVEQINGDLAAAEAIEDGDTAEVADRLPLKSHPIATYEDLSRRVAGILAFVAGIYALIMIWNPDTTMLENSGLSRGLDAITILFIGYILYHFFRIWIDSKIAEETGDLPAAEMGDEGGMTGASRLATLLPLFRGAILSVVIVSIGLIALLELGLNVSPLFAGAGVVGLAVGFGAQTLVRDIFSGAFFLIDDAFRKGEYIDTGEVKGTVEKISVRSFQLRHHLGALNTIPFGEIKVLTNYSRDWVIMKLPLRVTYDTDVERVRKLIKNLGVQLLDDPVIGENFIQPLKSQGVIEMQDSAMIIRVKFMTKPGDQWLVRKKVYEEIRELFGREGIRFAHREVTVRLADGKVDDLDDAQKKAVTGAAQSAIQEEEQSTPKKGVDDR